MSERKKILVAPLNWGLGHATRCIPIIKGLTDQGAEVIIAADGRPYDLLKREFPTHTFVRFPGFLATYPPDDRIVSTIIRQIPKLVRSFFREHRELKKIIHSLKIDAVISDNRFGLFTKKIPCIYISHQISIMMPKGLQWASYIVYHLNKGLIERYSECWIPDYADENNLSGKLSHRYSPPKNARYIGPLTRFKQKSNVQKEYDILALLSGPEPQRTILENILLEELKKVRCKSLVVRGIPEKTQRIKLSESISVISSLDSEGLNNAILASDIVISRPGYSTLMDLDALGKNAILIPTPGQTEQVYLAARLKDTGTFCVSDQENFSLSNALDEAHRYRGYPPRESHTSSLGVSIERLLRQIKSIPEDSE